MTISKELLVVAVTVTADVEDAWNRWYNETHLPEIVTCPGFISAQRYLSQDGAGRRYLTIYELSTSQALESAEFKARRGWGAFGGNVEFETLRYSQIAQIAA
jgi:antibiotic biosynthesis monooxygenase (ABM) superfamily enzyme